MKKAINLLINIAVITALVLLVTKPNLCKNGAIYGLLLSSKVIIPSLFPFSVFVLFILKSGLLQKIGMNNKLSLFILSLIGGYPIGAKVLNESVENNKIDRKSAENMLGYCVNAGPAFIILAVGCGLLNSKKIGYILFLSHVLASAILMLFSKVPSQKTEKSTQKSNIIDDFVLSVSQSASATLSICSYVILFSVILNYVNYYSEKFTVLKYASYLLEVTNATSKTKNVVLISFLLGFSGICIWFQVWGMAKNFKVNHFKFILFRILHGSLSAVITYLIVKIFKITLPTLSNGVNASFSFTNYTPTVAISLIIMGIIFIISLNSKNYAGNLLEDLV